MMKAIVEPEISVIIPTLNEENYCRPLFDQLSGTKLPMEVIVVDGGSNDRTIELVESYPFRLIKSSTGRGKQLFEGARAAINTPFLLFLHADILLPEEFEQETAQLLRDRIDLASFRITFDSSHYLLKWSAQFSRFIWPSFYFGDQGLWISKSLYRKSGEFDPKKRILEDQSFYRTAYKLSRKPRKIKGAIVSSSRKYRKYGTVKLQSFYLLLWILFRCGVGRSKIERLYQSFLKSQPVLDQEQSSVEA